MMIADLVDNRVAFTRYRQRGSVKIRNWWSVKPATSQSAFLVLSRS